MFLSFRIPSQKTTPKINYPFNIKVLRIQATDAMDCKTEKTEFLFILFSSCLDVHPQYWRGLAVSFVKIPTEKF